MPVRPATFSDLLPASKVLAKAFQDEDLFRNYIHVHSDQYPDDSYLYFLHRLRLAYVSGAGNHILVSCTANAQGAEESIAAVGVWCRYSLNPPKDLVSDVSVAAVKAYNYLESFVYPNRAANPAQLDILERAWPFVQHHWTGTRSEPWSLELLGTAPGFAKQGHGRDLVRWGFEQARKDRVGCSVICSHESLRFYQRCGFDVLAGVANEFGGDANPLKPVKGGTILFWDNGVEPQGVKKYGEA